MTVAVNGGFLVSREFGSSDANATTVAIDIPPGGFIPPRGVSVVVTEALSGGTPSIDVGDADNDDGWVATADITEDTIGTYSGLAANTAAYSDTGRYYPTGGQITAKVAADLAAGSFYIVAQVVGLAGAI